MQPFIESGSEHGVGRDDVERRQAWESGKQIEVGDIQPIGVGNPVGDGHDDASSRIRRRFVNETLAQHVLVERACVFHTALVLTEGGREKQRLRAKAIGSAIDVRRPQRIEDQFFETRDELPLAAKLVVQAQHLGDETGPDLKRQLDARSGDGAGSRLREHVAFD